MPILGAHMSIAGGYYKAVVAAKTAGCDCVQVFTKNNNQWRAKPLSDDDVARFHSALDEHRIRHPIAHTSYLINLASPDPKLWNKSLDAFVAELRRAEALGLQALVVHPGAYLDDYPEGGIRRVARALDQAHRRAGRGNPVRVLLETTAGQGTSLGWQFEELAAILQRVAQPQRIGVCVDTCHLFAAGYPLSTAKEYRATMRRFDRIVGLDKIEAFHLNDSKRPLGSRVDRHEHIGRGQLGLEPFRLLLRDRRFRRVPMYLETPKGTENGEDLDVINLGTLRRLARTPARR
ncbi:MAG: deoxyribonuclease IV [Pirellulales bacterium]